MKKKDKELTKVSMFYEKDGLIISLISMPIAILIAWWEWVDPSIYSTKTEANKGLPIFVLIIILYCLRRRVLDSNGVSASYLGIKYKRISWDVMDKYTIEYVKPKFSKEEKEMLVFTSKWFYGRTEIKIPATDEARMLAEKYFGPPAYVQEGVSFDDEKEG